MTRSTKQWTRNIDGLRANAQKKAQACAQRAEAAIALLIKEQRPINFKTVAQTAGISTAWLYEHDAIKQQIMYLRMQQVPKPQVKIPKSEQASNASQATMISALKIRVREQAAEIERLKQQVEVSYGLLHQQGGKPE
jgi:predicted DNA-binding transcriptional regulator AlpA